MAAMVLLGMISMQNLLIIGAIILLFFGGRKIPELMKGLGKGMRSFKEGMKEGDDENVVSNKSEPGQTH